MLFETGGGVDGTAISIDGTTLNFLIRDNGSNFAVASVDLLTLGITDPTAQFIHVTGVFTFNNQLDLYVNGVLADTVSGVNLLDWAGNNGSGLGQVNGGTAMSGAGNFEGDIALFRFYETALSDTEVAQNYASLDSSNGIAAVSGATLIYDYASDPDPNDTVLPGGANSFTLDGSVTSGDGLAVSEIEGTAAGIGATVALASGALVTLNADGSFDYDPYGQFESLADGVTTTDSFDYTVVDAFGQTATATATITITGVNDAPTEITQSYIGSYREGLINCGIWNSLDVLAGSVLVDLDNVVDPDTGDTHTFSIVDGTGAPVSDPDLEIINNELVVRSDASLALGTITSRTVIIRVDDGNGGQVDQTFTFDLRFNAGPYSGSATHDIAFGTVGADTMQGGDGSDRIFADDGNDFLFGDAGSDILEGGAGADTINGGSGRDGASYMGSTIGITVDMMNAGANTGDAIGDSFISIEALWGSSFADNLSGDNSNNTLVGSYGDDVLTGRGGNDLLQGGEGNDVFMFNNGDGNDTIMDFLAGLSLGDVVNVSDFGFADFASLQLAMSVVDGHVVLQLDTDDSIRFWGIGNIGQLNQNDFVI